MIVISISGIAVSNHLTPNDVQILFADLHYGDLQYVVTGQKHKGVIGIDFCFPKHSNFRLLRSGRENGLPTVQSLVV